MARGTFGIVAVAVAGCTASASGESGNDAVYAAWATHRSGMEVTASGVVARVLQTPSKAEGNRESFLLHLRGAAGRGLTVRIERDGAPRSGAASDVEGAPITVRGVYRYDSDGGVIRVLPSGMRPIGTALMRNSFLPILYKSARASYTERIENRYG